MQHRIAAATANPDFTVELRFADGRAATVDLREFVATSVVTEPLRRDPDLFVGSLRLGGDGAWLAWPGEVEIDADALWYQAHPEDLARDFGPEAAA
jgi:hypothetical protein